MPFPFLLGAAAVSAAVVGAAQAISGIDKFTKAKQIGEIAQKKYESILDNFPLVRAIAVGY